MSGAEIILKLFHSLVQQFPNDGKLQTNLFIKCAEHSDLELKTFGDKDKNNELCCMQGLSLA